MKIGIIGAMPQEIEILKQAIAPFQTQEKANCQFFTGTYQGVDIVLLQSGIGKVAASIGTSLLIECFNPDFIINTGSAGGFDSSLNHGDIVISAQVGYHDVDVTAFGYQMGQMASQPASFIADEKLISLANQALQQMPEQHVKQGLICTGDTFVCKAEQQTYIRKHFPNVIAVEMEAAAIAQTCTQFNKPFVVVRAISDVADKESPMSFEEFLPLAAKTSSAMVLAMIELASL